MSEIKVSLDKGGKIDLTKGNPGLTNITIGLGWDASAGGDTMDLDVAAILVDANGKISAASDLVYYGAKQHPSKSVVHGGDNLTGAGDGDDETVKIDFSKIPATVDKVKFAVNVYNAEAKRQNFGQVKNAYIRAFDADNVELAHYDLSEDQSNVTGFIMGEIYRHNGEWKFAALGESFSGDWNKLLEKFQ
jgi:tellurium resistance protein TerD